LRGPDADLVQVAQQVRGILVHPVRPGPLQLVLPVPARQQAWPRTSDFGRYSICQRFHLDAAQLPGRHLFPFTAELRALLTKQHDHTREIERRTARIIAAVWHRNGKPIRDFRHAWKTACAAAGCPGLLYHDLRRTAVRRFERSGIPRRVAMTLTGHKTESVYTRYAIVSENDLRAAVEALDRAPKRRR